MPQRHTIKGVVILKQEKQNRADCHNPGRCHKHDFSVKVIDMSRRRITSPAEHAAP